MSCILYSKQCFDLPEENQWPLYNCVFLFSFCRQPRASCSWCAAGKLGSYVQCNLDFVFPTCFFPCNRYRFAEIRYHRPEETHKGRSVPAHVETVVLFFPDVWHCLPTRSEWENLCRGYKQQLADKLQGERKEADGEQALNANPFFYFRFSQAQEHRHNAPHTLNTLPKRTLLVWLSPIPAS